MIRAVLDTNILVSGFVRSHKETATVQILDHWRNGAFTLVISTAILMEVERTFASPYFSRRLSPSQVRQMLDLLTHQAAFVMPAPGVSGVATHPEDDVILATAIGGTANYLVTGDRKLLGVGSFGGVEIVGASTFLRELVI